MPDSKQQKILQPIHIPAGMPLGGISLRHLSEGPEREH